MGETPAVLRAGDGEDDNYLTRWRSMKIVIPFLLICLACATAVEPPAVTLTDEDYARAVLATDLKTPLKFIRRREPRPPAVDPNRAIEVQAEAFVGTDGRVQGVRYVSGDQRYFESVREAAMRWQFEPARIDGAPVAVRLPFRVTFRWDDAARTMRIGINASQAATSVLVETPR